MGLVSSNDLNTTEGYSISNPSFWRHGDMPEYKNTALTECKYMAIQTPLTLYLIPE